MRNYPVKFAIILIVNLLLTINVFARLPMLNNSINANESSRSATLNM